MTQVEHSQAPSPLRQLPAAIWTLGFVSLLMDVSSEMIHSLPRSSHWPRSLELRLGSWSIPRK